jgi:hypothetical protein
METKTSKPTPLVVIDHKNKQQTKIFMLDEGDSYPMNTSTNYDHRYFGPSLVFKNEGRGNQSSEHYVNDFEAWEYIDQMMQLGKKYLDEHPDFNMIEFRQEIQKRREKYKEMEEKSFLKD